MRMGPSSFEYRVMVFEVLKPGDQVSELKLASVDFWVHILDLPFGWATAAVGKAMGRLLGEVKGVFAEGNTLQVRVEWDVSKPLKRDITTITNGKFSSMKQYCSTYISSISLIYFINEADSC